MHIIQPYRPLQVGFNSRVLEQNRRFFFTVSATLGVDLQSGEALLDVDFLKDSFESMGEIPTPEQGMPKPCGEFIVTGSYFAPGGEPVTGGEIRVCLGEKEKYLYVFGPRKWGAGGLPSRPEPITTLPIDYSQAFGGRDYGKNEAGLGYQDGQLPGIEDPEKLVTSANETPDPAGLSPLALDCPQRMKFKGTYDDDYLKKFFPGHPEDFDWHFFLNTPEDQWVKDFFQGNETFEIHNMHPELPLINGALPDLYARAFMRHTINSDSPEFGELPLNLDTVWFFPEKVLALLVFRGVIEIADDEAEQVSEVLLAYENRRDKPRTLEYYRQALEIRMTGENPFSNYFQTKDLIPPRDKTALALFQEKGEVELDDSALAQNVQARADASQKMIDEEIEKATQQVDEQMDGLDFPEDVTGEMSDKESFDLRKIMKEPPESESDPDIDAFTQKLETIMPGITSGDGGKIDLDEFPFDRIEEISEAAEEMSNKKEAQAQEKLKEKMGKTKEQVAEQLADLKKQSDEGMPAQAKMDELEKILADIDKIDKGETQTTPLPRLNARELIDKIPKEPPPDVLEAMQHLEGMKATGMADEAVADLEKQIVGQMGTASKQVEDSLYQQEELFKTGYMMGAHFMEDGLSPHDQPVAEVKARLLSAIADGEDVSGGDWSCLDLSGENLDNIDFSGSFLEQADFTGASLKGANLSGTILARADLSGADLTGANLTGANVGAVTAVKTFFARANLKGAKLSKSNFTGANFSEANLEEVESLYLNVDQADFSKAAMPGLQFLETTITGAKFAEADLSTSFFMMSSLDDVDFTGAIMNRCLFANMKLKNICFDEVEFCGCCFAGTDAEQTELTGLTFRGAVVKKSNFQRMVLKHADFTGADLENAYLESADLSGADFSGAQARYAQFRKADLSDAKMDDINLKEGSLVKARLVNTSLRRANLFQVDFLRSTITGSDFSNSNLDDTLIENWRPE